MDFKGIIKLLLFIFLFGCAIYIVVTILDGVNKSLKDMPLWMGIVVPILGIWLYDHFKEKQ